MKSFHKMAAYTTLSFIPTPPVSGELFTADMPAQDKLAALPKNAPEAKFSLSRYMADKATAILAWIDTDIEAELH